MASFWLYLIVAIGALLIGAIVFAFVYLVMNWLYDLIVIKARRKLKDKKKVSRWVEENQEFFKSKKVPEQSKKEVENDERRRAEKFREFEKLRRIAGLEATDTGKGQHNIDPKRSTELQGRRVLQDESSPRASNIEGDQRRVKLDE